MNVAYLEKIDPARNQMRFYAVTVAPTLFGQWAVVKEWGRIGQAGTVRQTWFESESEAISAGAVAASKKERRGYRAVGSNSLGGSLLAFSGN